MAMTSESKTQLMRFYEGRLLPDEMFDVMTRDRNWFPHRMLKRGPQVRAFTPRPGGLPKLEIRDRGGVFDLYDFITTNCVEGLIVLKDGQVAFETYQHGLTPETLWHSCSLAKSFASTMVGIAVKEGAIASLDDPVTAYADLGGRYREVTVRQLLRMTSGVRWNEDYGDPASERRRLLHIQTEWKKGGITGFMQDLPAAAPPGRRWVYNTGESYLVGAVMEGATGMNLVDYMSERFWSKVGMAQDARWWVESPHGGMAIAGSGMNACLGDYARLGLGEGRQIYLIAALDREAPFGRVVGWRDDLIKSDPDVYNAYLRHDPAIAGLPIVGGIGEGGGLDAETVIALRPDLLILNDEQQQFASETGLIEKLAAVGIAVVFIDFRFRPFVNTDPSIRALGKLFGKSETAERLVAWRNAEIARVTDRLAEAGLSDRPLVMIDRIPGYSDDCCLTFGAENFGRMVEMAGGRNLGSELLPGTFGKLNPEAIIAYDPDVVIVTGGSWSALAPGGGWVGLGPGADPAEARRKLRLLSRRPAFQGSKAVRNGRFYGIWHQFYNSPYQFAAIQQIARWIHPELFADLDAEARFRAFHERFLPVPYQPGYWAELGQGDRSPP